MKRIFMILSVVALVTGFTSCSNYLDVNTDPNNASSVQNALLIPSAQNYIAGVVGGDMFNIGGYFAQYMDQMPEASQYTSLAEYDLDKGLFNYGYRNLFAGALEDLEVIRNQATQESNWGDYFVATVLRAYVYQNVVDFLGMAPYTEALKGDQLVTQPKWDDGKVIYEGILKEMDDAEQKIDGNSYVSQDLILGKDLSQWIKFANSLRLKIYMRTSGVEDNSAAIKKLIDENNFITADVKYAMYSDNANKRNPWAATNVTLSTNNQDAAYPIISYMKATGDNKRIASIFNVAAKTNTYEGAIPGSNSELASIPVKNNFYSSFIYDNASPVYLITLSEVDFFKAEAYLRFYNDDAKAEASYEAAIDDNFATRGLTGSSDIYNGLANWSDATTNDQKLKLIGMQKWVALCMINNAEAWDEARRMGYPELSSQNAGNIYANPSIYTPGDLIAPWVSSLDAGKLVQRVYVPEVSIDSNPNAPQNQDRTTLETPLWWAKQ